MAEHPRRHRHRKDPVAAADVLKRYRRKAGGAGAPGGAAGAAAVAWPSVVGEAAARQSVPVRCTRAGVLTIACADAAWAHELSARRDELTARIQAALPDAGIAGLRFAVADHALPSVADGPPPPAAPARPTAAQAAEGEAAAQGVEDPVLRDLVRRAAAASAARNSATKDR
jgi:hypothetical protein